MCRLNSVYCIRSSREKWLTNVVILLWAASQASYKCIKDFTNLFLSLFASSEADQHYDHEQVTTTFGVT